MHRKPTGLPPSKEGVRTKGTGHCKYRVCSRVALSSVKLGKPAARQLRELCPMLRSAHLGVCNGRMGRKDLGGTGPGGKIYLFFSQRAHTPRQKYSCITYHGTCFRAKKPSAKQDHDSSCSWERSGEACSPRSCLLQRQKPAQSPRVEDALPHAAHGADAPALLQEEKWGTQIHSPRGGSASHPLP